MRLVQISSGSGKMRVAVVDGDYLQLLNGCNTVYDLAQTALRKGKPLCELAKQQISDEKVEYGPIYRCESEWRLLPPFTHPEPARCLVTRTGLTHKASADNRQAMHHDPTELSDSMRMYLAGLEGGHPEPGRIGTSPEWFYAGRSDAAAAHPQPSTNFRQLSM